jgi:hypothetical protein
MAILIPVQTAVFRSQGFISFHFPDPRIPVSRHAIAVDKDRLQPSPRRTSTSHSWWTRAVFAITDLTFTSQSSILSPIIVPISFTVTRVFGNPSPPS